MQPHIHLKPSQTRAVVIVVGDPARAKLVASLCESSEELAYNREYRSFDCFQKGQYFTVTSHGVGSAGCAVAFEELIKNGAKVIIRAGTAGSLQNEIQQGDVVVCHSAVREDGVSRLMVPMGFPAVADPYVFQVLQTVAKESGEGVVRFGMTLTSDLFYQSLVLPSTLDSYAKANVEIVEMEVATLFVIAKLHKIKAGAVCCVDGSPFRWSSGDYNPTGEKTTQGKKHMLNIVIEAAVRLSEEKNW